MKAILLILASLACSTALAIEPRTTNTYQLSEGERPAPAVLADVSWLAGAWTGTAFDSDFEAVWTPPSAGSMVGLFKLMKDGEINFYEILTLSEDDGRLNMKVKHFTADFVAWEDRPDFVSFKLVGIEQDAVHFSGLSLHRIDENTMHGFIVMNMKDGSLREEKLVYHRRQL